MHDAVRVLRYALPIAFVGFVAVLLLSYSSGRREPTPAEEVPSPVHRPDDSPRIVANEFDDTHSIGGRVLSRVTAEKTVGFTSGWYTLENVEIGIFRKTGLTYTVSSPMAEFNVDSKEADATGGVRVVSNDGLEIATREVTFDGNSLRNRIPIEFKVEGWSGRAGGVDLDVETQVMRLLDGVEATLTPEAPGELPLTISARDADFDRLAGRATFRRDVSILRGDDRIEADELSTQVDQERRVLLSLDGSGNVVIHIGSGEQTKEIHAASFSTETGPSGEIRAATFHGGDARARGIVQGQFPADLEADRIRVGLERSALRSIEAIGNAVMKQSSPETRTTRAGIMRIYFDAATGRTTSAFLEQGVTFEDSKARAFAARANYSVPADKIILTADPGSTPMITFDDGSVRAEVIELAPSEETLRARGRVVARLVPGTQSQGTIFPGGTGVVFVNADSLLLMQVESTATFSGHVKAWQGKNTLFADEIQIVKQGESITARGNVRSILYNTSKPDPVAPISTRSETLSTASDGSTIEMGGSVVIEDTGKTLEASRATFRFDERHKLQRVEVRDQVALREELSNRTGTAESAVYRVAERKIYLEGKPATISDSQGTIKGNQIVFDLARNRVDVVGRESPTEATFNPDGGG